MTTGPELFLGLQTRAQGSSPITGDQVYNFPLYGSLLYSEHWISRKSCDPGGHEFVLQTLYLKKNLKDILILRIKAWVT